MAKDSAAVVIKVGDGVHFEVPTGYIGATYDTVGMVTDIQSPVADLTQIRVAFLTPAAPQIPPLGKPRVDPQLQHAWIASNICTIKTSFAVD
jgi:hypothetical protein